MKIQNNRQFAWLLLFGSLWGISEVVIGGVLYNKNVSYASVWLSAWAFFVLALARGVMNRPGYSTIIGVIAVLFKLINAPPFFCHLLGIIALGVAFDLAATLLIKHKPTISYRHILSGVLSAYSGYALFTLVITYIVRYKYWTIGGSAKVLDHIFVGGSFAALAAIVTVPLGYWVGVNGEILIQRRPRSAFISALAASLILWTLGRLAG